MQSNPPGVPSLTSSVVDALAIQEARAILVILDPQHRIVRFSKAASLIDPSLTEGKAAGAVWRVILDRNARLKAQGQDGSFEMKLLQDWFDVGVFQVTVPDTGEEMLTISAYNISDRKAREFDLMESEASLEEASRIGRMGTFKLIWHNRAIDWSHQMHEIHGVTVDGYTPTMDNYSQLVHPDDVPVLEDMRGKMLSGDLIKAQEYRIRTPQGDVKWVSVDGRVLFDANGQPYATFGTIQDVTEAKTREEELRNLLRENAVFQEALQASPGAIAIVTTEAGAEAVSYANPEFVRIMGLAENRSTGLALSKLLLPETQPLLTKAIGATVDSGESQEIELRFAPPDGTSFDAQVRLAAVTDDQSEKPACVMTVRDLTADRRRAETLLQTQKMEALGTLSGGVAHEINNLLQPVITLADMGLRLKGDRADKVQQYLEVILSSGRRARDVLRQVLTFARKDTVEDRPFELCVLADDAIGLARSGLPPDVTVNYACDISETWALLTPTTLTQVIVNLVRNAADAMDGKGAIDVRLYPEVIEAAQANALDVIAGDYICLSVSDSGSGMDAATMAKVFEPFFSTKDIGKGTGLGLSVVYSIVRGWGGAIDLQSEVAAGTTVMVYIPKAEPDVQPQATANHG